MRYLMVFVLALMLFPSTCLCQLDDSVDANDAENGIAGNGSAGDITASISTEDGMSAEQLAALVVDSTANLESYRFLMDMDQRTELVNLSGPAGDIQKIASRSFGVGAINMTQRALRLVMATITVPLGDESNATAMAIDEYLINDTLYLKIDGNWTSITIPLTGDIWSQQNTLEQQVEMLNSSDLTLLGSGIIDGVDCYIIKADINTSSLAAEISSASSSLPVQLMNYSQLFNGSTLEAYYWITKDSHLLKRSDIFEGFVIRPQDLGIEQKGPENIEMGVYANISMIYNGFNESINIMLPADAGMAKPLPFSITNDTNTAQSMQAVQSAADNST